MSSKRKVEDSLANLGRAMDRLKEALQVPRSNPFVREERYKGLNL